ncbi:MAG TPA: DEAD/DEAH box helicase family protein, partial [Pirellulales bacterium]|nr:DEAD/DEAH box helicase family protein [Pirellulales bacterium]
MQSINFEFLRAHWPELAELGGFAEAYAHADPLGSLAKLRTFCEQLATDLHHRLRLPRLFRPNLIELLDDGAFKSAVPRVVVSKMHALRVEGNRAVHAGSGDTTSALRGLKDAHELARWLFVNFAGGSVADCAAFTAPPEGGAEAAQRRREKRAILERVAAQEAQLQQLLQQVEAQRERASQAEASVAQRVAALAAGQSSLQLLASLDPTAYDEAQTRRYLIDIMLTDAGWNVGPAMTSTDEVGKEIEVAHQPTPSGIGYADYVLRDEGAKPLAVIEAKRTSLDDQDGRTQAKLYADGLEAIHGVRPVIFYTNGVDLSIWNDAAGEPPRRIYGFYSKESLQRLHFQRAEKQPLSAVTPNPDIAGRMYQIEAVRRVVEKFAEKKRKALVVQATGTGKTRVAVSLCDAMIRARWAKRVLFICDRRELRKQAHNAFKQFLPSEPRTFVTAATAQERNHRVYIATYPAMMKCFATFDVGFFDLIIADESHRSIYNRYRDLFEYFDALQVGLTATPVKDPQGNILISHDTFRMFGCETDDPTFNFSYEEAITHTPPYLVPFEVETHTTPFLRQGIKYSQMTQQQKEQLEADEPDPTLVEYDRAVVDRRVFNKPTNRLILRNLMERGIKDATGSRVGKSIIFARDHNHAILLQTLFD